MGVVATETVFGLWWAPDRASDKFPGRLTWESPHAPVLEVLEPPTWMSIGFDDDDVIDLLHGEVDRFGWMSLLSCRRAGVNWGLAKTQNYRVAHVLPRIHLGSASVRAFRRIELDIPALAVLLGPHPLQMEGRPTTASKTIRLLADSRQHSWRSDGVEVEFSYIWSTRGNGLGLDVRMIPQISLTSSRQLSFQSWFEDWLVPLSNFVHIGTGLPFHPRSVHMWLKKNISRREHATDGLALWQIGIDPDGDNGFPDLDPRYFRPVITDLRGLDIHDVVRRASRSRARQEVFYDLLSSAMTANDRPLRNRYLDVVTAIEAFDSTDRGRGPVDPNDFKQQRREALAAVDAEPAKNFLKRWTSRHSYYSLEQRLSYAHGRVGGEWKHDASSMAKLRNGIAHGNADPDHYELVACFGQAIELARRLALREMGVG